VGVGGLATGATKPCFFGKGRLTVQTMGRLHFYICLSGNCVAKACFVEQCAPYIPSLLTAWAKLRFCYNRAVPLRRQNDFVRKIKQV
jgi:hypothetical protein